MLAAAAREAGRAAAGLLPARRRLALRPPRPLLRARADPGGVPPALGAEGAAAARAARVADLLERGGFNPKMNNALDEGGPRNGVMTALDDFIAEHERRAAARVLPIYFSLAIVFEEPRIAEQPQLGEALARLGDPAFLRRC